MPSGGVRVSVSPSVTFVYYVETAKRNIELCPPSASTTVRIFLYQTLWQYSDTDPQRDRRMQAKHKNRATFTNIRHYLGNDARRRYSYNNSEIRAH